MEHAPKIVAVVMFSSCKGFKESMKALLKSHADVFAWYPFL